MIGLGRDENNIKERRFESAVCLGRRFQIAAPWLPRRGTNSKSEYAQESDFDGERFLDVSAKMIAHFLETPNAA